MVPLLLVEIPTARISTDLTRNSFIGASPRSNDLGLFLVSGIGWCNILAMQMQYYMKELLSNPLRVPNGIHIPWDDVGGDTGVIATMDAGIIFQLSNFANSQTGGIVKITEQQYSDLKKNSNLTRSAELSNSRQPRFEASQWPLNDPVEVARSAALGVNMPVQDVMVQAPVKAAVPVTQEAKVDQPKISPSTLVKRGRGRPKGS